VRVFISSRVPKAGDGREEVVSAAVRAALDAGWQPFVAFQEIQRRGLRQAAAFMPYVRAAIETSQLVLVLYDSELRGGLIELGIAYALGVPLWLCHRQDTPVSSSALGCAAQVIAYHGAADLTAQLRQRFTHFDISSKP